MSPLAFGGWLDDLTERFAPCVWQSHIGLHPDQVRAPARKALARRIPLYSAEERRRRDDSPWTRVQAILAPLQFLAFAVSLVLVLSYLRTGSGYGAATASILVKTGLLYAIMITGSIWEKAVFGKWLFARAFFWEDVFSLLVLALQTTYLVTLIGGLADPRQQMWIAIAAYGVYVINAGQFLLKLRAARLDGGVSSGGVSSGWPPTEPGTVR
ncbi:MAG: 2-vinyl bacteriochlorophyllide hydratase [Alphaproteobacteria bacterium]|nr:2-vinyl bacteriochlorophyllide hydratase [Alphaproteobacteria bacterium]